MLAHASAQAVAQALAPALAVLVFVVDDWGYNNLAATGMGTSRCTPFLDSLAANGTVMSTFYTQPVCTPSRSALLTSTYPSRYGLSHLMQLRRESYGLPLHEPLWSEVLTEQGYDTALFGKWHLGSYQQAHTPHRRGFKHSVGFYGSSLGYYDHAELGGYDWFVNGVAQGYPERTTVDGQYSSDVLVAEFKKYLASWQGEPVFIYVPFQVAHQPMEAPPLDEDGLCGDVTGDYPASRYVYNQMLRYLDRTVEQMMGALEDVGLTHRDILMAVLGDNGGIPSFGGDNTPLRGEKGQSYEGGVRVPAFLWGRGVPRQVYNHSVDIVDVIPTLLTGAGWSVTRVGDGKSGDGKSGDGRSGDGKSVWEGIQWNQAVRHENLVHLDWCRCPFDWTCSQPCQCPSKPLEFPNDLLEAGLRLGPWKLIYHGTTPELYDLNQDVSEGTNVAREHPDVVYTMTQRIYTYYREAHEIIKPPCDPTEQPVNRWWLPLDYFNRTRG